MESRFRRRVDRLAGKSAPKKEEVTDRFSHSQLSTQISPNRPGVTCGFRHPALVSPPRKEFMKRKASAVWRGDLKSGKGNISTESGVLKDTQYSFSTRFESGIGTNPEELIGAAHAGCFSMALSAELQKAGFTADTISTTA